MNSPEQDDARSEQEVLKSEQESHSNTIEELLREVGVPVDVGGYWSSQGRVETTLGWEPLWGIWPSKSGARRH